MFAIGGKGEMEIPSKASPWRMVAAACLLAIGVGIFVFAVSDNSAAQRDLISYWAAGKELIHHANPYDGAAILPMELAAGLDGNRPNIMLNPPLAFFLALPLGLVSAKTGVVLWSIALIASLMASIRMIWILYGRREDRLHLLGYCFAPVLACLLAGQLGIFLLLGVVLFLYFQKSRPYLGGAALLLCALKPHLFLPFGVVLLAWAVDRKAYRILMGACAALLASSALALCFDVHAWSQYSQMMSNTAEVQQDFVPTLSMMFRLLVHRDAVWLQFLPAAAGCVWGLWYFWKRRSNWSWLEQGSLLLLVSAACAPHAWFSDEAMLFPAVLAGVYRASDSGRSQLPFGFVAGIALIEVLAIVQMTSWYYLWTMPAWIGWYIYATRSTGTQADGLRERTLSTPG